MGEDVDPQHDAVAGRHRDAPVFARAIDRGELPATADTALLADLVSGMVALRLATDAPLPEPAEITRMVDGLLHGFARTGGTPLPAVAHPAS